MLNGLQQLSPIPCHKTTGKAVALSARIDEICKIAKIANIPNLANIVFPFAVKTSRRIFEELAKNDEVVEGILNFSQMPKVSTALECTARSLIIED
jgi:hypothetical protein